MDKLHALPATSDVEKFRQLIARRLGLAFEDSKLEFLGDLLRRRLDENGQEVDAYLAGAERASLTDELGKIAKELTIPETYFFRNYDQFRALSMVALPERLRALPGRRVLRILSAGCASGEEPYSLAIIAREQVRDGCEISVRAVDVNPAVLARAERGRYGQWALRETPEEQLRWFKQDGKDMQLDDSVRKAVRFEQRNLSQEDPDLWPADHYDIVFCRNVTMYFTRDVARAVVARIARSLLPGGFLFLGHAETLRGLSNDFHLKHTHGTFYYQRKDALGRAGSVSDRLPEMPYVQGPALSVLADDADSWVETIARASERIAKLVEGEQGVKQDAPAREKSDLRTAFDLLRREQFVEALEVLHALPPEALLDRDVLILEAVLFTHSGSLQRAKETCARLLALDELSAGAHYVLALCSEAEGDFRQAAEQDQVSSYLDPTFAMPRLHSGLLARRASSLDTARRELGQALLLLQREDASRVLLFGGGFGREALMALCSAELEACGARA